MTICANPTGRALKLAAAAMMRYRTDTATMRLAEIHLGRMDHTKCACRIHGTTVRSKSSKTWVMSGFLQADQDMCAKNNKRQAPQTLRRVSGSSICAMCSPATLLRRRPAHSLSTYRCTPCRHRICAPPHLVAFPGRLFARASGSVVTQGLPSPRPLRVHPPTTPRHDATVLNRPAAIAVSQHSPIPLQHSVGHPAARKARGDRARTV